MMPSIAGRSASVSARAAAGARISAAAVTAPSRRGCQRFCMKCLRIMISIPNSILPDFRWFEVNDVVRPEPSGRALREARTGAGGELTGGAEVAVVEGG